MTSQPYADSISVAEWVFGSHSFQTICRAVAASGASGVAVTGEPGRDDRDEISSTLGRHGLEATGITPVPVGARDLAHPDSRSREVAVDYYRSCVDLSVDLGRPPVCVIPGLSGRTSAITTLQEEWQAATAGLRDVARYAQKHRVLLTIEPVNRYETHLVRRLEHAARLINDVGVEGILIAADVFHMSIEEQDIVVALRDVAPLVGEIQLADSNRTHLGGGHLPLADLLETLRTTGIRGPYLLEFLPPDPDPYGGVTSPEDVLKGFTIDLADSVHRLRSWLDTN